MAGKSDNAIPYNEQAVAKAARSKPAKAVERKIDTVPGLYLAIQPTGVASYVVRYQVKVGATRAQRRQVIGRHGLVELHKARRAALDIMSSVAGGSDPVGDAQKKSRTMTVGELFEQRVKLGTPIKASTVTLYRDYLKRHVPDLLDRPVGEITRKELAAELSRVEAGEERGEGGRHAAHNIRAALGSTFKFGFNRSIVEDDPTLGLGFSLKGSENERERRFTEEELRTVAVAFDVAPGLSAAARTILTLLLFTGQRADNVCGARVAELEALDTDKPRWRLPGSRMKKGREHVVALSRQSAELFRQAIAARDDATSEYVFPARTNVRDGGKAKVPYIRRDSIGTTMDRLRDRISAGIKSKAEWAISNHLVAIDDVRVHDMRKAGVTWMAEQQVAPIDVRMAILAHARRDVLGKHYEFASFEVPMRRAVQAWADHIEAVKKGGAVASNVVPLHVAHVG